MTNAVYVLCWPKNVVQGSEIKTVTHATFDHIFLPAEYKCELCFLQFSSTENFTEGTYNTNEDLCNPEIEVDAFCKHNGPCENLRRGLCAMPPFKQPRTLVRNVIISRWICFRRVLSRGLKEFDAEMRLKVQNWTVFSYPIFRTDRKFQVRDCLAFCAADFWSLVAYASGDQKPKHRLTLDFPSALPISYYVGRRF